MLSRYTSLTRVSVYWKAYLLEMPWLGCRRTACKPSSVALQIASMADIAWWGYV